MPRQGAHGGQDPSPTSIVASDCEHTGEANYFGKDFLRMAGIVQMLLALRPPYDKYPYAHPRRTGTPPTRDQVRSEPVPSAVAEPHGFRPAVLVLCPDPRVHTALGPVWPILPTITTAVITISSVTKGRDHCYCASILFRCSDCKHSHQQLSSQ